MIKPSKWYTTATAGIAATATLVIVITLSYWICYRTSTFLVNYGFHIPPNKILTFSMTLPFFLITFILYAILMFPYLEKISLYKKIKTIINDSLSERDLHNFKPNFNESESPFALLNQLEKTLNFFKSLEDMKTSKVVLESGSTKQLLNLISFGALFLTRTKQVTHINHKAEKLLGLIPGEILGQIISRKITNDTLLDAIDNSIEYDQRIIDQSITIRESLQLNLSIYPIKDKYGEILRIIIILETIVSETPTSVEEAIQQANHV